MLANSVAALMIASILTAQTPVPDAPTAPAIAQNSPVTGSDTPMPASQNSPAAHAQAVTLPAGTTIPLTLMTVIKSKSTKPGDPIRAVVAFPVTQGTQLAIPAGTYVEGEVIKVSAKPTSNQAPTLRVHFTQLVFTNGYSVPLNGENTQALLITPEENAPANEVAELTPLRMPGANFAMAAGQETMPTLAPVGPPKAAVIGGVLGGFAAFAITMFALARHRVNSYDFAVFDTGWQFQLVLDSPLTLDLAQVTAAAAMAPPGTN
jgi:hypothetical protein